MNCGILDILKNILRNKALKFYLEEQIDVCDKIKYIIKGAEMNKKIVIFDFDNTIVNSIDHWRKAINVDLFKFYGIRPIPEMKKIHGGKSNQELAQDFLNLSGVKVSAVDVLKKWYDLMFLNYTKKIKLIKGIKEYLLMLKLQGKFLVLASATVSPTVSGTEILSFLSSSSL